MAESLDEEEADLDKKASQLRRRTDAINDANVRLEKQVSALRVMRVLVADLLDEDKAAKRTPGETAALANSARGYLLPLEASSVESDAELLGSDVQEATAIKWVGDEEEAATLSDTG